MLSKLLVSNYVLIDSLEIGFPEGLVIITGETGAGKSILLGALSLVLGARADAGTVGPRGDTCVVEAEFDVEEDEALRAIAQEYDLDTDGGHLIIRRTVARSGRSRSFVNDQPVQVGALQALSARLVDIHSQHQTRLLTDRAFQLEILDHYAGDAALRDGVRASHARLLALRRERADAAEKLQRMASERDFNQAQLERLEAAKLRDGELEALEAEQRQLANAEEIKTGLGTVGELFAPSDDGRMSLDALLKEAGRSLGRIARYVPAVEPLAQRIDSARLELEDIREEVEDLNASTELSEDRLAQVEDRLSLLYALMKKHGCSDIGSLISLRDTLSSALFEGDSLQDRLKDLDRDIAAEEAAYDGLARRLHEAREAAAPGFAAAIGDSLRSLELEKALFTVAIEPAAPGAAGADAVLFKFSSTGREPVDLARCASGGEISRIMLSLKAMMARYTDMPTMVFDEIDTGVSGSAADRMGAMIADMGADMQVFAITHLPQVAAKGGAHYLVTKEDGVSSIRRIEGETRVREIARMLSGARITDAAIGNARELLS